MTPIDRILMFALNVNHDETTRVEVHAAGGLTTVAHVDFDTRAEALAYAERLGVYYTVEVEELEPAQ